MTRLVSMKMSKKQSKGEFAIAETEGPRFPHGLSIHLNGDSMKKLGFTELPAVGTEMIVVGVGKIASASENRRQNGIDRDMSIQLERIEVEPLNEDTAADAVTKAIKDV